jgi:rare lipoprotein A (peptidoglycan hydrolase)
MFLFRTLSVPRTGLKTQISGLVLVSFVAQSCSAISTLSQRNDQSFALPDTGNETISSEANLQKASTEPNTRKNSSRPATKHALNGTASWYGPGFHGKKTASGEIYDQNKLTAAHKSVPLGSKARVTNLENGNSVEVEINDRGPFVKGRIIDLSRAAAGALGIVESGTAPVHIELIRDSTGVTETASNN